jgi:SSS family solute:Na+ symporter
VLSSLGALDLIVLLGSLALTIYIGFRFSGRTDLESYLLGDRNLPWWAILGSIVATETSTATVLSVPGEAYGATGMKFLQLALGYIIGRAITVYVLLPLYFRGQLFTAYQVLDRRFGQATKQGASLLFLVTRNLGDGLRLYLAALVLQTLVGWPFVWSVVAMGAITILYTYFGGMRSVVWNDCIQLVIYMAGALAAVFVIARQIPGGWDEIREFGVATGKFQVFDVRWSLSEPFTFWAALIGGAVLTIGTHGTDHMMVQRYLSARSQRDAGRALFLSGIVVFLQFAVFLFIGVELACYYSHYPEITFAKADEVFAHFMVNHFPKGTGLVGLMLAAILAAAMSTLSSSLNSSANALVNDFYRPWQGDTDSPERLLAITRGLTIAFGVLQIGIGVWALQLGDTVVKNALTIAGFSAGLLLGVFSLGVLTRRTGQVAALLGGAIGLAVLSYIQFWPMLHPEAGWKVAFPWLALIGASSTFLAGYGASFVFPRPGDVS